MINCYICGSTNRVYHRDVEKPICRKHYRQLLTHKGILKPLNEIEILDNYALLKLPRHNLVAKIDIEDIKKIIKHTWSYSGHYLKNKNDIFLHRLLMNMGSWKDNKMVVDHINGDGLDNRKFNLRICTIAENVRHRIKLGKNNNTGHIGVNIFGKGFRARLTFEQKEYHLGLFKTLEEAILVRKQKEKELYGNFTSNLI